MLSSETKDLQLSLHSRSYEHKKKPKLFLNFYKKLFKDIAVNRKGNKTLRNRKLATFVQILFSISRDHFENVFPGIIQKEKEMITICRFQVVESIRVHFFSHRPRCYLSFRKRIQQENRKRLTIDEET